MMVEVVDSFMNVYCPADQYPEEWDFNGLTEAVLAQFGIDLTSQQDLLKELGRDALAEELREQVSQAYAAKEQEFGRELMQYLEKMVLLQVIDHHWKDHLLGMDQLRDGIGLRGYGQKDPLIEYKREGFDMFAGLMQRIKADTLERLFKVQIQSVPEQNEPVMGSSAPVDLMSRPPAPRMTLNRGEEPVGQRTVQRDQDKVGRNDPCPCGSGKKYKKCHGR